MARVFQKHPHHHVSLLDSVLKKIYCLAAQAAHISTILQLINSAGGHLNAAVHSSIHNIGRTIQVSREFVFLSQLSALTASRAGTNLQSVISYCAGLQ
jgi:hypothetical protein